MPHPTARPRRRLFALVGLQVALALALSVGVWRDAAPLALLTYFALGTAAGVALGLALARGGEGRIEGAGDRESG